MEQFIFQPARLKGLCLVSPFYTQDDRGYFLKRFERDLFYSHGIDMQVQESIESRSKKGVLRGLHFQTKAPQAKLISCLEGHIFDVAVDLRHDSQTFGQWEGFYLKAEEQRSFYIPAGFAHGFLVLSETARVSYQCDRPYLAVADTGIIWNDADVKIDWPLSLVGEVSLSPKDQKLPTLQECIRLQALPEKVPE